MTPMSKRRSPLGELYDSVTEANGWSQRQVETRAASKGTKLSKSHIGNLINTYPLSSISSDAIRALALGLNISPNRVALAAIQSMGFNVSGDEITPAEAIARDATLSDDTRNALLAILRASGEGRRGA